MSERTEKPICPYCSYVEQEVDEINFEFGDNIIDVCTGCGKRYRLFWDFNIVYSSEKLEPEEVTE